MPGAGKKAPRKDKDKVKKAVIFDLDGTLVNSLPDIAAAMNRSLEMAGLPTHDVEKYKYFTGDGVINLAKRVAPEHPEKVTEILGYYSPYYHEHCRDTSHAYAGMTEALIHLKDAGCQICVLTNKDQADAVDVVAYYFPGIRFDVVRGRQEGFPIKPDPAGPNAILAQLGLQKSEVWYVGDTATDMRCGQNAGLETIGVTWGFRKREELEETHADHIVDTPDEMARLMLGTN